MRRNLVIFTLVTVAAGWIGLALDRRIGNTNPQQGLGILLWILGPTVAAVLLRAVGGDGWRDSGLRPLLRVNWHYYLAAVLLFPLVSLLTLALAALSGVRFANGAAGVGVVLSLAAAGFATSFVKNILEEFGWRGYLTPRLAAYGLPAFANHLLTGIIWAGWHIPYWLYFVNPTEMASWTSLDRNSFILLGLFILIPSAVTYGQLRLLTNSIWPAVILHSVANGLTVAFITAGFIQQEPLAEAFFSPGNAGLVNTVLFTLAGVGLYYYRTRQAKQPAGLEQPLPAKIPSL
jgi:membrane protease YdiL (CAAX protease family)